MGASIKPSPCCLRRSDGFIKAIHRQSDGALKYFVVGGEFVKVFAKGNFSGLVSVDRQGVTEVG